MPNFIFDKAPSTFDLPSLADNKTLKLTQKFAEKQNKLDPANATPTPADLDEADRVLSGDNSTGDGLLDMAEASIIRGSGNIADSYANLRQRLFGDTDFKLSEEVDSLSDQAVADQKAGFTGREAFNQDIGNLTELVGKEDKSLADFFNVAKQGLALGPRALADSAASGAELAAGAGITAAATLAGGPVLGAATGGLLLANKGKKAAKAIEKVVTLGDRLKKGAKAVPSVIAKSAGRTSLLTADITEQMRQDYKAANNGAEPSAAWYGTNVPITMALNAVEFGIITRAVPKFSKPAIKDMKEAVKFMSKSHSVEAAKRILNNGKKVLTTAGAEAAQEYLQTWHEILAPVVDGSNLDSILTSAVKELGVPKNQTEAIVGSILGFGAGGTARAIGAAPSVVTGTAVDATKATAKTAVNVTKSVVKTASKAANKAQNRARIAVLSDAERESIRSDFEVQKAVVDTKSAELDKKVDTVQAAEKFEDLTTDEGIAPIIKTEQANLNLTDEDLSDPANFNKLKDKVARTLKADKALLNTKLQAKNTAVISNAVAKNTKNLAVKAAVDAVGKIPKETVVKTVQTAISAKNTAAKAIELVKELKSSTALGVIEMGIKGTTKQAKTVLSAAKDLEVGDLDRVAAIISEKKPELGKKLFQLLEAKKEALESTGQRTSTLVNEQSLSPVIKDVANKGNIDNNSIAAVSEAITTTMAGKIEDKATLQTIKKAIAAYRASEAYKDKTTPGRISDTSMQVLLNRIANMDKRLSNVTAADKVKTAAKATVDKATSTTKKVLDDTNTKKALDSISNGINLGHVEEALEAIPNLVKRLKKQGYETAEDIKDFIDQFPAFDQKDIRALIEANFKTDTVTQETTDNVKSDPVPENEILALFKKLLPGCSK